MNADLSVGPDLAESWTSTEDLKQWTFTLRRGVKFHNGREMVADDVIAGLTRLLDPQSAAPSRSNYVMIEGMSAPDPYTVRFNLSYPYSGLPISSLIDRSRSYRATWSISFPPSRSAPAPSCSKSYTPGDRLIMVRNPNYFQAEAPETRRRGAPCYPWRWASRSPRSEPVTSISSGTCLPIRCQSSKATHAAARRKRGNRIVGRGDHEQHHAAVQRRARVRRARFTSRWTNAMSSSWHCSAGGVPTIGPIPPTHPFCSRRYDQQIDPSWRTGCWPRAGHPNGIKIPSYFRWAAGS
jgi:peptide/nickel transport system substrate-binding protein